VKLSSTKKLSEILPIRCDDTRHGSQDSSRAPDEAVN
jgi:hypothetical protein